MPQLGSNLVPTALAVGSFEAFFVAEGLFSLAVEDHQTSQTQTPQIRRGSITRPGNSRPAAAGPIGQVGSHFAAQGLRLIGRAGQLHHEIRAQGRKALPLGLAQRLPTIQPHHAGVGAAHRANSFGEALRLRGAGSPWSCRTASAAGGPAGWMSSG